MSTLALIGVKFKLLGFGLSISFALAEQEINIFPYREYKGSLFASSSSISYLVLNIGLLNRNIDHNVMKLGRTTFVQSFYKW